VSDLDDRWAWSQVEAMADDTLPRADEQRMRAAMAADARLRQAVARAATVRGELKRLARAPVPPSQRRRLLQIPNASPRADSKRVRLFVPAVGLAVAAAAAIAVTALLETSRAPRPAPPEAQAQAQAQAVADFAVAMTYLRRSAAIASTDVTTAVRGALPGGREAARDNEQKPNGE
jgi:hypothetical protein